MSTQNVCFHGEIRKILTCYPLLSRPMFFILCWEKINLFQPVHSSLCPYNFQFPSAQPDIPSVYFYSLNGFVVEEINSYTKIQSRLQRKIFLQIIFKMLTFCFLFLHNTIHTLFKSIWAKFLQQTV